MSMRRGYSTDKGLIARPEYRHLTYAWPVRIMVSDWAEKDLRATSWSKLLAERAMQFVNPDYPVGLSVTLHHYSPDLITRSMFIPTPDLVTLLMRVDMRLSDQFLLSVPTLERRPIVVLPRAIALRGCTATIHRIRAVTYSALSLSSGAHWQEPPPWSIANRKTTGYFSASWEIRGDGSIRYGSREIEPLNG